MNKIEKNLDIEHIQSTNEIEFTFIGDNCVQYRKKGGEITETITRKQFDKWVISARTHLIALFEI
jgi:hypothetical protein